MHKMASSPPEMRSKIALSVLVLALSVTTPNAFSYSQGFSICKADAGIVQAALGTQNQPSKPWLIEATNFTKRNVIVKISGHSVNGILLYAENSDGIRMGNWETSDCIAQGKCKTLTKNSCGNGPTITQTTKNNITSIGDFTSAYCV
jgi:hypothetical protein